VLPRFVGVNVNPRGKPTNVRSGVPVDDAAADTANTAAAYPRGRRGNGSRSRDRG